MLNYMEERVPTTDSDKLEMKRHEELKYGPPERHIGLGPNEIYIPVWWIACKSLLVLTGIIYVLYKGLF